MKLKMDVVFVQTFANAWQTFKQKAELLSRAKFNSSATKI